MQISDETERGLPHGDTLTIGGHKIPIVIEPALDPDTILIVSTAEDTGQEVYLMAHEGKISVANADLVEIVAKWRDSIRELAASGSWPLPPRIAVAPEEIARREMGPSAQEMFARHTPEAREWVLKQEFDPIRDMQTHAREILAVADRMSRGEPMFVNSKGEAIPFAYLDARGWPHAADGKLLDVPVVPTDALRADWRRRWPASKDEAMRSDEFTEAYANWPDQMGSERADMLAKAKALAADIVDGNAEPAGFDEAMRNTIYGRFAELDATMQRLRIEIRAALANSWPARLIKKLSWIWSKNDLF